MDSFELNKIIGAVLGTLLFVMGVGFLAEAIYHPIEDRGPGYTLPEPEVAATDGEQPEVVVASIGTLLASASAEDGQGEARKCQSCHTFNEGGANGQGPNLWGIVERPVASHEGFVYSPEMVAHAQEAPLWTYEELNAFILAPKEHVPGTKMNYNGVKNDGERANIIAYLSTLTTSPIPFPPPDAPEEAAPTEGEMPAAEGEAPAADAAAPAEDAAAEPAPAEQMPAPVDATTPSTETNTAPVPASEGATPAPAGEATPVSPATTPQSETPVQGTSTGTEVPAGTTPQ